MSSTALGLRTNERGLTTAATPAPTPTPNPAPNSASVPNRNGHAHGYGHEWKSYWTKIWTFAWTAIVTLVLVCAVLLGRGVGVGVGDGNGEGDSSMEGLNRFWRRIPWGRRDEDEFRGQAQDREGAPPRCTLGRHAGRLWNWGGGRGDGGRCVGGERGRDENEDDREHRGQGGDGEEGRQAGELVRARDGRCGRSPKQEKACLSPTRAGSLSRFAFLPPELVTEILLLCASPAGGVATNIALLSWSHHALIMPRLYGNVSLCTPRAFRLFRTTLALHNPILGKYVRTLQVGSALFDRPGYVPDLLAEQTALAVGLEQILLACPALQGFQIDLFALAALATGTAARLERGAQPVRLSTELALPAYLALPTFAHTEHLSLLAFGLDAVAALEVCAVLPRLKSLSVRWVTRNEDAHREEDTQMVVQAIDSLLEWPPDSRTGRPLVALEIRAWPAVVGQLRAAFPRSRDAEEMMDHLEESAIVSLDEEERGDAHKPGLGANSDERSRLFLGLDMERYHGPRKGLHTHWWQEHAFRHWG